MILDIIKILSCSGLFLLVLSVLVHICAKHKYSFKYESTKRKFEIYPNSRDKPQTIQKKQFRLVFC